MKYKISKFEYFAKAKHASAFPTMNILSTYVALIFWKINETNSEERERPK